MNIVKKILIVIVIVIFTYIIWRLLRTRVQLQKEIVKENFTFFGNASDNELDNATNGNSVSLISAVSTDLPLREYCIKASYNTAITGNYVNLDMITYVINRGCRFIDFEVFYIGETSFDINNLSITKYSPQVAYSVDSSFKTISTENSILLDKVLTTVVTSAFSAPTPNINDPIFINLRIKSDNKDIYKAVAASIDNTIRDKLYLDTTTNSINYRAKKVTNSTLLSDIQGKIIVCIDKTVDRNYKENSACITNTSINNNDVCYELTDYINIETGSEDLNLLRYSEIIDQCTMPINVNNNNKTTDVKTMKLVVPNTRYYNAKNPIISDFILKYSAQIPAFCFYKNDRPLQVYEEFFDDYGSAFVPLATAIPYFKKMIE
jgi:hypothetical protein